MSSTVNAPPPLVSDTPPPLATPSNAPRPPIPIIAAACGGGLILIMIASFASWCALRKRRKQRSKRSSSPSVADIEKQQLDPASPGHDPHTEKANMPSTSMDRSRQSTSSVVVKSAAVVKVHKMYTPPSPKMKPTPTPTSTHARQPSVPNVYASPRHSTSVPVLATPPTTNTDTSNTSNTPAIPPRRHSRSATVSSNSSMHLAYAQLCSFEAPNSAPLPTPAHSDSVQIDIDSALRSTVSEEITLHSGATTNSHSNTANNTGPIAISSKAKRELLQQREQMKRSPSFSMSNVPFPLAPLPPIPDSSNPTSPTLSPTTTPTTSPIPAPLSSSHRISPALVPRSSLRRESRDSRKSFVLQFSPPPPPPMVPIPAPPQDRLPLPPSLPLSAKRNPAFTHQRRTSSRGQELDEIVRQVREEDSKVEAHHAAGQVSNLGPVCSRSTRTSLQQLSTSVNISRGGGDHSQHPLSLQLTPHNNYGSNTNGNAMRSRMGPSHHYMPNEHQPPTASPPLPDSHALAAAVEAAAAAAAEASTLARRISTASHRLSKYNNASSPNLKLQAAEFNKEHQAVSVREQARPRSRSFSSTLVPASLPGSPSSLLSSSPTSAGHGGAARSSSSSPLGLAASLPQHLQAPRPLLQQPQYSFLPSSSMVTSTVGAATGGSSTPPTSSPPSSSCVVGLGISSQPLPSVEQPWSLSSTPPASPPLLRRQSSFSQLNGAQLPSAHIPAQWRGRFAPDVEKYGGSTPRTKRSTTSSRSSTTDSPPPGLLSPTLSWTGDELPSQTKERLLRHAASSSLQTLPEGHSLESERRGFQSRSHSHSRSSSVSSISDSDASMSTPSRTPAQMYHAHHGQTHGGDHLHHHHHESDMEEGDDEELRRIIEDAIKIASAKAAAARVARESMSGNSPLSQQPHRHAYQLSDSSSPTVN
ncbi:hypothetical protein BGZ73_003254 [Actinomortierella ambigua]|nr:hypothetical protein BGZ73_003254 [Actinomortierella ambigua]